MAIEYNWTYNCNTVKNVNNKSFEYDIQWILTGNKTSKTANRSGWLNSTPEEIQGEFEGFPIIKDEDYINFIKSSLHGNIGIIKEEIKLELKEE